jgi:hypothetical protein
MLTIICVVASLSCGDCVETPSLASITPNSATAGGPSFTLTVIGNHFQRNSAVQWDGKARATTFINENQLNAAIAAADVVSPASAEVTVFSPPQYPAATFTTNATSTSTSTSSVTMDCAGGTSNALNFAVSP